MNPWKTPKELSSSSVHHDPEHCPLNLYTILQLHEDNPWPFLKGIFLGPGSQKVSLFSSRCILRPMNFCNLTPERVFFFSQEKWLFILIRDYPVLNTLQYTLSNRGHIRYKKNSSRKWPRKSFRQKWVHYAK